MTYDLGDTVALGIENRDGDDVLANATAVTCTITLPDGTTTTGTVVNPSTGSYEVDYAPTMAGRFLVRWIGTGANAFGITDTFDVRAADDVPVVSLAEAKRHLNIATTTDDDELRRFLDAATDLCERVAGRPLRRTTVTETHDGGRAWLQLRRPPVLSVASATEDGVAVTVLDLVLDGPAGLVYRDADGTAWDADPQGVSVTYVAGDTAPPADAQQAVLETLRHLWTTQRGTMSGRNPFGGDEYAGTGWSLPRRAEELLVGLREPGF